MDDDAVGKAEQRVVEVKGAADALAARLEDLGREGRDTDAAELALAIAERALELARARLDALLRL